MDIQILEAQITGLDARIEVLKAQKDIFVKASGLEEAAEQARADREAAERDIAKVKKDLADLQAKKSDSLKKTTEALSSKMSEVLPAGKGIFEIGDDGLSIGWEKPNGRRVPWAGLSGSERNCFDQALSYALLGNGDKIILMELAESDLQHLEILLEHLEKNTHQDTQIIACTWLEPTKANGWSVVRVEP
jgi:hypothetical protein